MAGLVGTSGTETVSQSCVVLHLHGSVSYTEPQNFAVADNTWKCVRKKQGNVLEGRLGERERDRVRLSKAYSGPSPMGMKDCKDYRNSGEGIGWKCGHRKDMEGTDLSKRKVYGWQVNSVKNREGSGEESSEGKHHFHERQKL